MHCPEPGHRCLQYVLQLASIMLGNGWAAPDRCSQITQAHWGWTEIFGSSIVRVRTSSASEKVQREMILSGRPLVWAASPVRRALWNLQGTTRYAVC
jgi:hypothetical protein